MEGSQTISQGRDRESCGNLSWEDLLDKPEDLSDRESEAWVVVLVVLDVMDVLVSFFSVVTEFCDGFSCCSDWEFVESHSFLSPESVLTVVQLRRKRWCSKDRK